MIGREVTNQLAKKYLDLAERKRNRYDKTGKLIN